MNYDITMNWGSYFDVEEQNSSYFKFEVLNLTTNKFEIIRAEIFFYDVDNIDFEEEFELYCNNYNIDFNNYKILDWSEGL